MALLPYNYAWAAGHGVALASLRNVEDDLYPYTKPRRIVPRSQPPDLFPVRTQVWSGEEFGDGAVTIVWEMTLPDTAVDYILDTYLSSETVTSAAMTINTRRHQLRSYIRGNCYFALPSIENGDLVYVRQGVMRCRFRFLSFTAL